MIRSDNRIAAQNLTLIVPSMRAAEDKIGRAPPPSRLFSEVRIPVSSPGFVRVSEVVSFAKDQTSGNIGKVNGIRFVP